MCLNTACLYVNQPPTCSASLRPRPVALCPSPHNLEVCVHHMLLRNMTSPTSVAISKATHLCPTVLVVRGLACQSDSDSVVVISPSCGRCVLLGLERIGSVPIPVGSSSFFLRIQYSGPTCPQWLLAISP